MKGNLKPEYLRQMFSYDAASGRLFRLSRNALCNRRFYSRYYSVTVKKTNHLEHRLIWILHNGEIPEGMCIDHINGDSTDNRIENLRLGTLSQNQKNRKMNQNNKSGFTGVMWNKRSRKWRVTIMDHGKKIHCGLYENISEAAEVAATRRQEYGYTARHGMEK